MNDNGKRSGLLTPDGFEWMSGRPEPVDKGATGGGNPHQEIKQEEES